MAEADDAGLGAGGSATSAAAAPTLEATGRHATLVAIGILFSRVAGLARNSVMGSYLSTSPQADAFSVAFRIPNFLQNLFGEGVLSASFIPVYASLVAKGERDEAQRVAGAVLALLSLVVTVLVLVCVAIAPLLVTVIVPGFDAEKRALTVSLARILFPGAGLLALSAWCLGILNSHRRFLLSYSAPVLWSAAMIVGTLVFGARVGLSRLAVIIAWASVVGSLLQLLVQLPAVLSLLGRLRLSLDVGHRAVRDVMRGFGPAFVGRGVVQISAYVDSFLASFLISGSVAAIGWAQVLYSLPVSLFGMSVSAAELPAMSSARGSADQIAAQLRTRLAAGVRRISFWIVPSVAAFLFLGDVIAAAVYERGRFTSEESVWVWGILGGAAFGLMPATLGRLYASTLYALRDTRTPLRFALVRVAINIVLGYTLSRHVPPLLGIDPKWGAAGLTLASAAAGWIEFSLLRSAVASRVGATSVPGTLLVRLTAAALIAAAAAWGMRLVASGGSIVRGLLVLGAFGVGYFALTAAMDVAESRVTLRAIARRLPGRRPSR